ncbi:MAG: hypothetical protein AAF564_23875 [Bacteroidota bacterium]
MFNYATYLESKGPLDARSLNQRVWDGFVQALNDQAVHGAKLHASSDRTIRLVEVGGGIGAMFRRIAAAGLTCNLAYTLVDIEAVNIEHFRSNLEDWLVALGYKKAGGDPGRWQSPAGYALDISVVHEDIHAFIAQQEGSGGWDGLIAQAFLDLFDLDTFLSELLSLLGSAGVFYFPINFDGITSFLPPAEPSVDMLVESIYHQSMDDRSRQPALRGRSQSGRHLMQVLSGLPVHLLEIGSSDWVVFPRAGQYADKDQAFLAHMLRFVAGELEKSNAIDTDVALQWIANRQQQLHNNQLMLLVHQLDLLGQVR